MNSRTPEQTARDTIDSMLARSGWVVVDKTAINWNLGPGFSPNLAVLLI